MHTITINIYLGRENGLPNSGSEFPTPGAEPGLQEQNPSFPHLQWGQWDLWVSARDKTPSSGTLEV